MDNKVASANFVDDLEPPTLHENVSEDKTSTITRPIAYANLSEHDQRVMKRLKWKVDLWILPMLAIIYFLASLDRTDIGNVQIAGMQKAVHATDTQWAQVVSLFFIGYVLSQPIGTIALRRMTPPVTIGFGVILWGTVTTTLMAVKTWRQAVGVRILIGAGEGWIHAATLYLSFWYGPRELATRGAIYYSTSTLAGAFNGLISYAIIKGIGNREPYHAWQWILLVEGVITIGFGVIVLIILPEVPERVKWGFTSDEKRLLVVRTWNSNNTPNATFKWKEVPVSFRHVTFYTYTILFCATQIALTSIGSFLPATIKGMGYSSVRSQLMSVPIYACAFVVTIGTGYISDRIQRRGIVIAVTSTISLIGYIMLVASKKTATRYAGVCIAAAFQFPNPNLILAWVAFNTRAFTHRAVAGTLISMLGQAAALAGLQGFNTPPYYIKGDAVVLAMVCLLPPTALFTSWHFKRLNDAKAKVADHPSTAELRAKSLEELGSDHPDFIYSL